MKSKKLWLYKAKKDLLNFNKGNEYISMGPDKDLTDVGIYISNLGQKESCSNSNFNLSRALHEQKVVVAIFEGINKTLTIGEEYSLYGSYIDEEKNSFNKRYIIVDDNYRLYSYASDFFIDVDEYNDLKENNPGMLIEMQEKISIKAEQFKKEYEESKKLKELEEKEKEKERKQKQKEYQHIKNILKAVSNEKVSTIHSEEKQNDLIDLFNRFGRQAYLTNGRNGVVSVYIIILGLLMSFFALNADDKNVIFFFAFSFASLGIFILGNSIYSNSHKKIIFEELNNFDWETNYHINIKDYESLSTETLGKIKYIEQQLSKIKGNKVSDDVLALINKNIQLVTNLCEIDAESSDVKLSELLDEVISYNNTLIENKEIEEEYIKEQLAQNIHNMIEENKELFNSMAKDNHYLTDNLKNDKPLIL